MKFPALCVVGATLLMTGCVSQQKYDESMRRNAELEAQYQQLQQQMGSEVAARDMQISRMQNAIKVTVNGELLFPSGSWEMPQRGKTSIAKIAAILAPHQRDKIKVNGFADSTPIGPALAQRGVPTNLVLSKKRADTVMDYMISQG